jgi:hypothetical protein
MPIIVNAGGTGVMCLQFLFASGLPFAAIVFTLVVLDMFWAFYVSLCTYNMQDDGCET